MTAIEALNLELERIQSELQHLHNLFAEGPAKAANNSRIAYLHNHRDEIIKALIAKALGYKCKQCGAIQSDRLEALQT